MPRRNLSLHRSMRWTSKLLTITALGALAFAAQPVRDALAADADFYVSLRYEIDGSVRQCWNETAFRRSVARRVGYDPFREAASIDVSIRISGSARAVEGRVEWRNANGKGMGERRIVAEDGNCSKLLTEISFAVSLQIELLRPKTPAGGGAAPSTRGGNASSASAPIPATVAAPPPPSPSPPSPPPASPPRAVPPPATPKPEIAPAEKVRRQSEDARLEAEPEAARISSSWPLWVGIGPSLALGIAPSVTGSARLFFGVRHNDLSVEVGAEASYPSTERKWDGTGFRQSLIGGSAAVCGHHRAFSACVLGKASQVRVSGLGLDQPKSPTGFVAQVGLRFAATMDLGGPWSATAHIDTLGLLTPCTVDLNHFGVWDMPRLGALAGIDLSARFR
jgi:hypothetical protein